MFTGMDTDIELAPIGSLQRGGDKPAHTVIEGENLDVLRHLSAVSPGTVDMIYIDPPYNTGARFWTYNNDFAGHQEWLAFMRDRLVAARPLLKDNAVLVCAVDAVEVHRLGVLLEELFPTARRQMITTVISPSGQHRSGGFRRVEEYLFFIMLGDASPAPLAKDLSGGTGSGPRTSVRWDSLIRSGPNAARADRPTMFYPFHVDAAGRVVAVGEVLDDGEAVPHIDGTTTVLPLRSDGTEGRWRIGRDAAVTAVEAGTIKASGPDGSGRVAIRYLQAGVLEKIERGQITVRGRDERGVVQLEYAHDTGSVPRTVWSHVSHSAAEHGSRMLSALVPGRAFTFPKSLYAVEDALTLFVGDTPDAVVLDFFGGSGTTTHAVMRLNQADGGNRTSVLVTNNEVGRRDADRLQATGVAPGSRAWEARGACQAVTIPRITAAVTGRTLDGSPVAGTYQWGVTAPIAHGLDENVAFYRATPAASRPAAA